MQGKGSGDVRLALLRQQVMTGLSGCHESLCSGLSCTYIGPVRSTESGALDRGILDRADQQAIREMYVASGVRQ